MNGMILENLKHVATALAAQFGENCEVVIHDLTGKDIEHSIVFIENGQVSGRKVGDGPSQVALDTYAKAKEDKPDHLAYLLHAENGRLLKSSTVFIRDEEGTIRYIFAINFDITGLTAINRALGSFVECREDNASTEPLTGNVNTLLDELIERSVELVGVPVRAMTKEDKIKALQFLNDAGAFLITKSGDKVAKYFGISKYTLYSYVDINK